MALVNVTGYLYNAKGETLTTGKLFITLQQDIVVDSVKVAPIRIEYDLSTAAPVGYVNVNIYPTTTASPSGVSYLVEFDPDPSNTTQPRYAKTGYWRNYWSVPNAGSVAIGSFVDALRGSPVESYLPLATPAVSAYSPITIATGNVTLTAADNGRTVVIDTTTAATVTLPVPVASMQVRVSLNKVTGSGAHAINPGTGVTINGNGLSKAAGATLTIPSDVAGDFVLLVASSATSWWIVESRGSWV